MSDKFDLDLNNPKVMEEFVNHVVVAKLIAEEAGVNPSYEKIVGIADELDLTVADVQGYLRLYSYVSKEMML